MKPLRANQSKITAMDGGDENTGCGNLGCLVVGVLLWRVMRYKEIPIFIRIFRLLRHAIRFSQ